MKNTPIDYQEAIEQFRKEELTPDTPVRSGGKLSAPPMTDGYIDYQAVIKKWDKQQAGKYTIYTMEHEKESQL